MRWVHERKKFPSNLQLNLLGGTVAIFYCAQSILALSANGNEFSFKLAPLWKEGPSMYGWTHCFVNISMGPHHLYFVKEQPGRRLFMILMWVLPCINICELLFKSMYPLDHWNRWSGRGIHLGFAGFCSFLTVISFFQDGEQEFSQC